jgi:hypothetical protein
MIIIPMCPLSKIFNKEMQPLLMKDPTRVFKDEPFSVIVSTSRKDYRFEYMGPSYQTDALLLNYFLGGDDGMQNQETDWTGLVKLDLDTIQNGAILGAVAGVTKIDSSMQDSIEACKEKAKILSNERVMRQIRSINSNMLKQYQLNKTEGKEAYMPSATEFLAAFVLADEQKKNTEERQEITAKFAELLNSYSFGG